MDRIEKTESVNGFNLVFRWNKNLDENEIALYKKGIYIGYLGYNMSDDYCKVEIIRIKEPFKRIGHGSFLLQQIEAFAKTYEKKRMLANLGYSSDYESKEVLMDFYTKNGYSVFDYAAEKIW